MTVFDILFEIQVRAAFEHAWIVATHPLTYKSDSIDWKRFRLAAQLKANVEQLDLSVLQFERLAEAISEAPWPDIQEKRNIAELIERLAGDGTIPTEAMLKDMSRFSDNLLLLLRASKKRVDVRHALIEAENGLRALGHGNFPQSASILQVCMAVLFDRRVISAPLQKYSCHVTRELAQLFPGIDALSPIFQYKILRNF
jgi:hypothetical protein